MIGKKIQIGAEAEIILYERKNWIFKDRKPKSYRLNELDEKIRKLRTRSEIKLLEKASKIIPVPKPIFTDSHDQFRIILPLIEGSKLSESLDDFPLKKQKEICQKRLVLDHFKIYGKYKEFVFNQADYQKSLAKIKHSLMD